MRLIAGLLLTGLFLSGSSHLRAQTVADEMQMPDRTDSSAPADNVHRDSDQPPGFWRDFAPGLKRIADDQGQLWRAPLDLRRPAAFKRFLPLAGLTGVLIASDRSISRQIPAYPVRHSHELSNYAAYSLAGGAAGLYALGKLKGNDRLRETGILSGEAALNSALITYALEHALGRQHPNQGSGMGAFLSGGDSFPSQHAAIAWSVASTIAHQYPGPLTKLTAYGLASTVTVAGVTGKQHFPSDAFAGSALGWYVGRQVFRRRQEPELDGDSFGELDDKDTEKEPRPPGRMASTYVALDSWIYPAIEKLAAFGYLQTAFLGLKPWTRMECAQLIQEASAALDPDEPVGLAQFESALQQEFAYELALLDGVRERNITLQVESLYARVVSLSGPPLTDGDHFGQTLDYDFGRPFRQGFNAQTGGSVRAALGPVAFLLRAEFQHAPAAAPLSDAVRTFIAKADLVNVPAATAFAPADRPRLLDAYVALNLRNGWQLSFGKQSLAWAPGPGGSFLWSNNIEPVPMLRFTQSETHLPALSRVLGPVRVESFFGRLEGHTYIPHPYVYGSKINFKPLPNLELGFGRSCQIGGKGGDPLTTRNFVLSFFGQVNSQLNSVPGDSNTSFDWSFHVPKVKNYLVFYGDWYADDDFVPFQNPARNPYRPGIYLTRFPRVPKLDFHLEAASTESPGQRDNHGNLNYWNYRYRDGYTNQGNLIGNTVGRMGRSIQCWFRYWISPRNTLQFIYKHNTVSRDFVPQGGAWQNYSLQNDVNFHSGLYVRTRVQYEHISRYPMLFHGPQNNLAALLELGLLPQTKR